MSSALTASQPIDAAKPELSLLDRIAEESARIAARYKPVMSVDESLERYLAIEDFVAKSMKEGIDYGRPPGFPKESKPFLFKPGAQKLCAFFGYVPAYELMTETEDWMGAAYGDEPLFYYKFRCVLAKNGDRVGEGIGSCNSRESKYRYRNAERMCPQCGAAAIIKGKEEFGGGFRCWNKKGGCGAKFEADDPAILEQKTEKIPNPDIADVINTCQKQAEKRAYVEATLSATGASSHFSQDEDVVAPPEPPKKETKAAKAETNRGKYEPAAPPRETEAPPLSAPKVPEELMIVVDKLRKGDYSAVNGISVTLGRMCASLGIGAVWTNRVAGLRSSFPKGKAIPANAMEGFLLDVWGEIEAMRLRQATKNAPAPKAEPAKEGEYVATDDDVPF